MKIKYEDKTFLPKTLDTIAQANTIIAKYQADGFKLTLRQLYYQFVSRDLIENKQSEYKRLGSIISDARLAGLIDWYSIEDRTRRLIANSHWENPGEIIGSCAYSFRVDKWKHQENHVEVWIEKDALTGVIDSVCRELDISYFSCRGYTSQSSAWDAGQRLERMAGLDKDITIIHLGDHDPSGMDMTRDITDRVRLFSGTNVTIDRIALNMDQVDFYKPPPNPAKLTDSRCQGYISEFGSSCWELDALDPNTIVNLIREKVMDLMDEDVWQDAIDLENGYRDVLNKLAENWETYV